MNLHRRSIWAVIAFAVGLAAPPLRAQAAPGHASQLAAAESVPQGLTSGEWSGIRAAYEANRHAALAVDGGYNARNPGQQWLTRFDGRGFSVQPDTGGWTWGLQLQRYGFDGRECAVSEPTQVSAAGQRVAYDWDDTLQEWYVNDARGLEHGYIVHQRPPQEQAGPLTLTLAVRGGLAPQVRADGRGVNFVNSDGVAVLTYAGLSAFDADGQVLPARFESLAGRLLLTVDERGADYPLTIDPIVQQAYLKASNPGQNDDFGSSVSVSGDTVVVGAPFEDSNATGVNGNQSNNSALYAGAAYVFVRSGTSWSQQAYLKASNTGAEDVFGTSVSVSGDTVVVGAYQEDSNALGVNGDQSDNSAGGAGAAYVFVRSGTNWSQQAYLKASNTGANDEFGIQVSVSGDTVVVGAPKEDSFASGVNGDQDDNSATSAGAAYVFVRSGTSWSLQAYLKASNTGAHDGFGSSMSVSGDTVVVGAWSEDSHATGVDGDQSDDSFSLAGAAYVFVRSGTSWSQQAYLKASNTDAGDGFGGSVAVAGDTVVVGAFGENSSATGVNGNQNSNNAPGADAAYVFVRSGPSWSQQAYLKASNTGAFDTFGTSVSVSSDTVVVGALQEDSFASGVNGDQSNNIATNAGAAYVFRRSATNWSQQAYLKASNPGPQDFFSRVAVSGDTVVVGAWGEDSSATGVNGDQSNNGTSWAGAAYVFDLEDAWTDLGSGLAGSGGTPLLAGTGPLTTGSTGTLTLSNAAPTARSLLLISLASAPVPFKGGTLVPNPVVWSSWDFTSWGGVIAHPFHWPNGIPSGTAIYLQYAILDGQAIHDVALSNAQRADVP